ncbi:Cation/H+ exchanger [Niveomyces insectorum RCEF 264]|uniref:Cation/H+ exchanger n=1 Tax=Niveomyces insectorum RCEF 264 TaxID=1081102 RepID=A0A167XRS8_9HYPO|nr:Cation/H+ exchanger [Niveomyces insectorum RCEF 264]
MCLCSTVAELALAFDNNRALGLADELHRHLAAVRSILAKCRPLGRQIGFQVVPGGSQSRALKIRSARATKAQTMDGICRRFVGDPASFWLCDDENAATEDKALVTELRHRLACVVVNLRSELTARSSDADTEGWIPPDLAAVVRGRNVSELRYAGKKYIKMARKLGSAGSLVWLPLDVPSSTYERYLNMDDEDAFSHLRSLGVDNRGFTELVQALIASQFNALFSLYSGYGDLFPAADRLLLLLDTLGGKNIPADLLRALQHPRHAWGADGEVNIVSPEEFGIVPEIVALGEERVIMQAISRGKVIIQKVLSDGTVALSSNDGSPRTVLTDNLSLSTRPQTPPSSSASSPSSSPAVTGNAWALQVLCYACPLCYEGKAQWTRDRKQAMWALFEKAVSSFGDSGNSNPKMPLPLRVQAIDALLFFAERDLYAIRSAAVERARSLLLPSMDFYYHASVTLFESIMLRLKSRFDESNAVIRGFLDGDKMPGIQSQSAVTPLQNALLGRLHVSWLENKIHCYDSDVGAVMYAWGEQSNRGSHMGLSSLEIEVTRRLQGTAAKYFHSVGDFDRARTSLEQHLLLLHTQSVRDNTRMLLTTKLAETHCELRVLDRATSLIQSELIRVPKERRTERPFRRLAMADLEVKLVQELLPLLDERAHASGHRTGPGTVFFGLVERALAVLADAEPPELDDLNDQVLHMRRLLLVARVAHQRALWEDAVLEKDPPSGSTTFQARSSSWTSVISAWSVALQQAQTLSVFAARHPWTPVVAYISIAHAHWRLSRGGRDPGDMEDHRAAAEAAWAQAAAISRVERCEYVLPTLAMVWVPLMITSVRREQPAWAFLAALAYHEPSIEVILIQASFIILLNVLNWVLDKLVYCGLVGQILVGVAWGTPGLHLLTTDAEKVIVQLGYIGLIMLVFEGKNTARGLSTSIPSVRANIARSAGVAVTGISAPIALSFILAPLAGASHLQCFAAGAALCSTSLGTTFTVLKACGLGSTRLGVVLTSAAMLDDVVGLVMVQVIANLGGANDQTMSPVSAETIVRPILVSVGFAVVSILACRFIVQPLSAAVNKSLWPRHGTRIGIMFRRRETTLVLCSALLIGLVTAASFSGTSNLVAAYIAGAVVSWWDSSEAPLSTPLAPEPSTSTGGHSHGVISEHGEENDSPPTRNKSKDDSGQRAPAVDGCSGSDIFQHYYHPAVKWVFQPFFFASIGFSIPITHMFTGSIIWRGVVYAILMGVAKLFCGVWLVRVPSLGDWLARTMQRKPTNKGQMSSSSAANSPVEVNHANPHPAQEATPQSPAPQTTSSLNDAATTPPSASVPLSSGNVAEPATGGQVAGPESAPTESPNSVSNAPTPLSLYPGAILGLAMVPRGEIGFLISSVAKSNGVFSSVTSTEPDIFLIVTWAIVLCTVFGPLSVGLLVRRVKRLSAGKGKDLPSRNVLGVWGI